jgi:hypothetical protein
MTTDTRVYVEALRPGVNANAAVRGQAAYVNRDSTPVRFDFDQPAAYFANIDRGRVPTVFESEQAAHEAVAKFQARVRAIIRYAERTAQPAGELGIATMLVPKQLGGPDDAPIGGYKVVPFAALEAELAETQRLHAEHKAARVAAADGRLAEAQAEAEKVRAEELPQVGPLVASRVLSDTEADEAAILRHQEEEAAKAAAQTAGSEWHASDVAGVQQRAKADGTVVYRARVKGANSESFGTAEEAQAWREARQGAADRVRKAMSL